ncbi:hypothetical protein PIB30_058530 [Stylosanthes scabra]|uniref:Uncharacterized protein n=1 Tax=Stylosanthes scabra TaxID=79078 RepID=A0ABU6QJU4_9FABA|nr:hypothetical protein [Stylosanthes scabra]
MLQPATLHRISAAAAESHFRCRCWFAPPPPSLPVSVPSGAMCSACRYCYTFRLSIRVRCHFVFAVAASDSRYCLAAAISRFRLSCCFAFLVRMQLRVSACADLVGILLCKVRYQIKILLGNSVALHSKGFYKALSPYSMKNLFKLILTQNSQQLGFAVLGIILEKPLMNLWIDFAFLHLMLWTIVLMRFKLARGTWRMMELKAVKKNITMKKVLQQTWIIIVLITELKSLKS